MTRPGPAYLAISDELRDRILRGALQPGEQVPSEAELMDAHGVSRTVAKMAIQVLRHEGLIDSFVGRGSFVRQPPASLRRWSPERYERVPGEPSPFIRDASRHGHLAVIEHESQRSDATAAIAERLAISEGDTVTRTRCLMVSDGQPVELCWSYEPLALTQGTTIESPDPYLGVINRFDSIGLAVTEVVEDVTARAPRPEEATSLRMHPGVPVLEIHRTYIAGDVPVETCDIAVPADRYSISYRTPVA